MCVSQIRQMPIESEQFHSGNHGEGKQIGKQKIYFIRHGQSVLNIPDPKRGMLNSGTSLSAGITNEGVEQAKQLGQKIVKCIRQDENIVVCASEAIRAQHTANYIFEEFRKNASLQCEQVTQGYAGLNERSKGDWEGIPRTETADQEEKWKTLSARQKIVTPELTTGESWVKVIDRALPDVQKLIDNHRGKTIFVVTHAALMQALTVYWNGYLKSEGESRLSDEPGTSLPKVTYENGDILSVEFDNSPQAAYDQEKNVTTHLLANLTALKKSESVAVPVPVPVDAPVLVKSEKKQNVSCFNFVIQKICAVFQNIFHAISALWHRKTQKIN